MTTQPAVLLIGRSLTLAAIGARLKTRADLTVRQVDTPASLLQAGQAAPDAVIIDKANVDSVARLMAEHPQMLLMEVGVTETGGLQLTVHDCEQRLLSDGNDLVTLILEHASFVAGANGAK